MKIINNFRPCKYYNILITERFNYIYLEFYDSEFNNIYEYSNICRLYIDKNDINNIDKYIEEKIRKLKKRKLFCSFLYTHKYEKYNDAEFFEALTKQKQLNEELNNLHKLLMQINFDRNITL